MRPLVGLRPLYRAVRQRDPTKLVQCLTRECHRCHCQRPCQQILFRDASEVRISSSSRDVVLAVYFSDAAIVLPTEAGTGWIKRVVAMFSADLPKNFARVWVYRYYSVQMPS